MTFQLLRTSPGLLISLGLLAGGALVCTITGLIMAKAGSSLRSIYWLAGFFAMIVVPQVAGHFWKAIQTTKAEAPQTAALQQVASSTPSEPSTARDNARSLFGSDADPHLISDVRQAYGDVFATAELAQLAVLPDGDTVLLARFQGSLAAEKGWVNYLRVSGLNQWKGKGDSQRGYVVTRPTGDHAYALHFGNMVGIWTGRDDAAIRRRMLAGGFKIPGRAPLGGDTPADTVATGNTPSTKPRSGNPGRRMLIAGAIAAYLFLVVLYYFKGAAWAGTIRSKAGTPPIGAGELAGRLEGINALDVPFRMEKGSKPNEYFATWRYADAKWMDLARVRGMRRTFRIRLTLDEKAGTVRTTDYVAGLDGSVGRGGASLEWKAALGIVFFQMEKQRVFGLQLDDAGRFKPELSYAYTFNLQEMKSPLVEAVTHAGWNWRPTVWQGPTWLRWLTE